MGADRKHESRPAITRVGSVVFGDDVRVLQFIADRVDGYTPTTKEVGLGVEGANGQLIAGVSYGDYNGVHCGVSIASEPGTNWASRRSLFSLFYYPFVTLNCVAISVSVASTNPTSLNLAMKLGFIPEALIRYAAHDGSTLVVLKMTKEQCKWIDSDEQGRR